MAGPIWKTAMLTAHENLPIRRFGLQPWYDRSEVILTPDGLLDDSELLLEEELLP
jgi:hypothetical protein